MKTQKEAVFAATQSTLSSMKIELTGPITAHPQYKAIKDAVCVLVVEAFGKNEVGLSEDFDRNDVPKYTRGLVNNWHRKDTRLNGGEPYKTKNPGSRAGSGNSEVKELKVLRKQMEASGAGADKLALVDAAIEAKLAEHKASKIPQPDMTKISPEILKKLGLKAG